MSICPFRFKVGIQILQTVVSLGDRPAQCNALYTRSRTCLIAGPFGRLTQLSTRDSAPPRFRADGHPSYQLPDDPKGGAKYLTLPARTSSAGKI